MPIVKQSGVLSADELYKLVAPVVVELYDEIDLDARAEENVAEKLGFVQFKPSQKNWQIQTKLWLRGTPLVGEWDSYTVSEQKYGNKIGYDIVRMQPWKMMSSKAKWWLEKVSSASEVPTEFKDEMMNTIMNLKNEVYEMKITENEYKVKVFTDWFKTVSSEFWPWSAVYDGKALFATDHIIIDTGATYSNIVDQGLANTWTADGKYAPLTFKSLKYAVKMLREMKDGLGNRVKRPTAGIYDLVVSPELESTALDILSDNNGFSPYNYNGTEANNDNFANIFATRDGFKVRLVVLETLNQPYSADPTQKIGSDTMWFLINKDYAKKREAFRDIIFKDIEIDMFDDKDKKATVMRAEKFFWAQALYPEVVVGSKGDATTI